MDFPHNSWTDFETKSMNAIVGRKFTFNIDNNDEDEPHYGLGVEVNLKKTTKESILGIERLEKIYNYDLLHHKLECFF